MVDSPKVEPIVLAHVVEVAIQIDIETLEK